MPIAEDIPLLYEDDVILIADKPAGLLTQEDSTGRPSLYGLVREYLAKGQGGDVYLAAVHRIDLPVSGMVLFAKTAMAAGRLSEELKLQRIRRFYGALVSPPPGEERRSSEWRELRQLLLRRRDRAHIVNEPGPRTREVSLKYLILAGRKDCALLLMELLTGRRHQIRVQLSSLGTPIVGDAFYGSKEAPKEGGIGLHAACLSFLHPMTRTPLTVISPLPPHFPGRLGLSAREAEILMETHLTGVTA